MSRTTLDHCLICLGVCRPFGGPCSFKFEEWWFLEPDFFDVVSNEWNRVVYSGNRSRKFALKLKALKVRLKVWNRHSGSSLKGAMEECKRGIRELDSLEEERPLNLLERGERERLKLSFMGSALKEDIFWRQRSRVRWLKEGDKNMKYFHNMAFHCKNSNELYGLNINGSWSQDQVEIRKEVEDYYGNLYREDQFVCPSLDGMIFDRISGVNKSMLERQFSEDEVWKVVSSMKGDKSLGSDGFSISFFQKCWD